MKERERIAVYVDVKDGKTVCICTRRYKGCGKHCEKDFVERDRFFDWQNTMNTSKYGPGR